jgi:hypothetical protein
VARWAIVKPVHPAQTTQIALELDPGEPISGSIRTTAGATQSFRGWLELATKLEQLRNDGITVPTTHGPPRTPK